MNDTEAKAFEEKLQKAKKLRQKVDKVYHEKHRTAVLARQKIHYEATKTVRLAYARSYYKEHAESLKETQRTWQAKKDGISYNYKELLATQKGLCAICKGDNKILHVDHNHATKVVRGLLCGTCNKGLGLFYENVEYLQSAIIYLEKESKSAGS